MFAGALRFRIPPIGVNGVTRKGQTRLMADKSKIHAFGRGFLFLGKNAEEMLPSSIELPHNQLN